MHLLDRRLLFVRKHVGLRKLIGTCDLLAPGSRAVVDVAQEKISGVAKTLRLPVNKALTSAGNHVIAMRDSRGRNALVLAASLVTDIVFKERK